MCYSLSTVLYLYEQRRPRVILGLLILMLFTFGATGCSKPMRNHAAKVATSGVTTADNMVAYYDLLAKDTQDVWELTAFRRGFLQLPPPANLQELNTALGKQYAALQARKRMAKQMSSTYSELANLASYDASADVLKAVHNLQDSLKEVKALPLPDLNGRLAGSPVTPQSIIDDIVVELSTVAQNRAIARENKRLLRISERMADFFSLEKPLYQDIAQDRADRYKQVAKALVEGRAVISGDLVNRVLASYDLRWPAQQEPFQDEKVVQGILQLIDARSEPIVALSRDAADGIENSLRQLVVLHKNLVAGKASSLAELAEQSTSIKAILESLAAVKDKGGKEDK